jgi:hypothetical protein
VLIRDRDPTWSATVRVRLGEAGISVVQTPYLAPNANAYAERFVRSIKEECLDRVIPFGEGHLRRTIAEYVEHYHRERNHQGIENMLIAGAPATGLFGRIRRRPRSSTLTVDPRGAPETVLRCHAPNEASKLYIDGWSAAIDASIPGALHDATLRPWPVGSAREPAYTGTTNRRKHTRADGHTAGGVDPNGLVRPTDGAGP